MAALPIDWEQIKSLALKGMPLKDIADKTQVSYHAIRKRASRERWSQLVTQTNALLSHHVSEQLQQAASRHLLKMSGLADFALTQVDTSIRATPTLVALEKLAHIADTFDRIARRTYGLDNGDGQARTLVQIAVTAPISHHAPGGVIDVEPVADIAPDTTHT